ncbi:MAG: DUF3857 domain-containing protein [candidate division Zixibacteria bacterium]|nr:DUF3857 domain-containing protein [candidate division Zixibacteria bacterium]
MVADKINIFYLIIVFVLIRVSGSSAQNSETFPVECLYDSVFVEIKSDYTAEITFKEKYLFNQARVPEYSVAKIPVNRHIEFSLEEVTTILADGREIKLDNDDIETISDFTPQYYPDSKSKIIHFPSPRAGSVVILSYKLKYRSLLYLPRFFRQRDIPTYNSYLEINSKISYTYYVSESIQHILEVDSKRVFYTNRIPALRFEDRMPPPADYQIVIKPDSVVYEGERYGFSRWSDVALFYNELSRIEYELNPDGPIKTIADSLVYEAVSSSDSLSALLDFVKDNIRYISVNIGRGEFKPFDPLEVLDKRYGDCRDQSALLAALCRAVGFKADPALMTTRDKPDVIISLPWPGFFNHVITAVDTGNGYLFLDASQATCCFSRLPSNLRNRRALICGNDPYLEFTLTSPFETGNDIEIKLVYDIGRGGNIRADVDLRLFRDPAFLFHSDDDEQVLSDVIYAFLGDDILSHFRASFRVESNSADFIRLSGYYFENSTESPKSNRLLVNTRSPFLKFVKNYFQFAGRTHSYNFDFTFSVNEAIQLKLPESFTVDRDSVVLSFNERGLRAQMELTGGGSIFEIKKSFNLFDYTLSADRYNRFNDFLLIASQIPYNSAEIIMINEPRKEEHFEPDNN